jgi:Putative porin
MEGLEASAGKFGVPFYQVGKNQLIWDGDLNVEGGALQYGWRLNKQTGIHLNGGGFWVNEESGSADASLWGIQAYIKHQIDKPCYVLAGVSYFDYGNIQGHGSFADEWDGAHDLFGNSGMTGNPDAYESDFDLLEFFVEYGTEIGGTPVAVWGDWVKNMVAVSNEDTGWLIGGRINKAKDPGTWEFSYDYRDLELDAVVGQFNDSDAIGGGTGGKGHRFGFAYALAKNTQAALTYFAGEFNGRNANEDYDRLQADIKLKF